MNNQWSMINESIIKNHLSMNHLSIINHQMYSIYVMGKKSSSHQTPSKSSTPDTPPRRFRLCCFGCRFGPENWALLGVLLVQHLGAWASPPPLVKHPGFGKGTNSWWKHVKNGGKTSATPGVKQTIFWKNKNWWMWCEGDFFFGENHGMLIERRPWIWNSAAFNTKKQNGDEWADFLLPKQGIFFFWK